MTVLSNEKVQAVKRAVKKVLADERRAHDFFQLLRMSSSQAHDVWETVTWRDALYGFDGSVRTRLQCTLKSWLEVKADLH
ncbi:MAG: hypothetical protein ACOYKZ_08170 [Chlamydiia bacterium]